MTKSVPGFKDELTEQKELNMALQSRVASLEKENAELKAIIVQLQSPEGKARTVHPATQEWKAFT